MKRINSLFFGINADCQWFIRFPIETHKPFWEPLSSHSIFQIDDEKR